MKHRVRRLLIETMDTRNWFSRENWNLDMRFCSEELSITWQKGGLKKTQFVILKSN